MLRQRHVLYLNRRDLLLHRAIQGGSLFNHARHQAHHTISRVLKDRAELGGSRRRSWPGVRDSKPDKHLIALISRRLHRVLHSCAVEFHTGRLHWCAIGAQSVWSLATVLPAREQYYFFSRR